MSEVAGNTAPPTAPAPGDRRPLVSIVLPTYNGARYLEQSIESCLAQTLTDWELILVDDCSTDDTPRIIERYVARDPGRIRSIRNNPNRKLPGSLNVGFAAARGELLTWTSDDNAYRPEALAEMAAVLRDDPSADFVYAHYTVIDEHGRPVRPWRAGEPREIVYRNVVGACFLYRRAVHERLGGYAEDRFLVEDWDFWQRASIDFRLRRLDRDLYLYRYHPGSLTSQRSRKQEEAIVGLMARNVPKMRRSARRADRGRAYLVMAAICRLHGRKAESLRHMLKAFALAPRYATARVLQEISGRRPPAEGEAPTNGAPAAEPAK